MNRIGIPAENCNRLIVIAALAVRPSLADTVRLPAKAAGAQWLKASRSVAKVLVVDDHADVAPTLAALIVRMGHETRFATSCEEAMQIVPDFHPEIAFIDLAMPHVNGFECARLLLERLEDKVRLFAMSGYAPNAWPEAPQLFEKYLLKPVLSSTVKELIGEPA